MPESSEHHPAGGSTVSPAELDALRTRYRAERDRRLRPDGTAQYRAAAEFGFWADDPYAEPETPREPIVDEVDAIVVGGGFGGLVAAARLSEAGLGRVRVIDKAADLGGTWYWNRYPGVACDIESYIYLPLLEEVGDRPTMKYAPGEEIRAHAQAIGRHYDLYRDACLRTEVTSLDWDETANRWTVHTDHDDVMTARYVVISSGPFSRPKMPGIPGIESFAGHTFHTSRWDYDYTGGTAAGGMDRLAGKRVAVIGTGATAIQCVPHLARDAEHLFVVQRTPSTVDERNNRETDTDWFDALTPGWQRRRRENFLELVSGVRTDEDMVEDRWTDIAPARGAARLARTGGTEAVGLAMEVADFEKMNELRDRVTQTVTDPRTAEALKPWYRQMCKRPTFSDTYLQTFNRPNVTLVDTEGRGVDRVTERGLVVGGQEYQVDCVIFATGFEVGVHPARRAGIDIRGRGGLPLAEYWADGLRTFHGYVSHGFPNCFHIGALQNAAAVNFAHVLEEQATHIAAVVTEAEKRGGHLVEPTTEAEDRWVATIREKERYDREFFLECTPGYYNNEGNPRTRSEGYGGGAIEFHNLLSDWRANSDMSEVLSG